LKTYTHKNLKLYLEIVILVLVICFIYFSISGYVYLSILWKIEEINQTGLAFKVLKKNKNKFISLTLQGKQICI